MTVGKPLPASDAVARVTGKTPYAGNWNFPRMLVARVLRSPHAHALIRGIDTTRAAQVSGVVAILTSEDLGQPGGPANRYGVMLKDRSPVAKERVRFAGEPVAAVAAETAAAAREAVARIKVEYEPLPAVFEAREALAPGAPSLHAEYPDNCFRHAKLRHGDVREGFAAADLVVEETYTSPIAHYAALEPHITAAQWQGEELTIWTTSQAPYRVKNSVAELFQIDPERVRVIVPPLGGGFGGKGHVKLEPLVVALAWKANGRPVKLTLSHPEEFVTVIKHAATIKMKSGVTGDGHFTAHQATVYWNGGAYADISPGLVGAGMLRVTGPYRFSRVHVDSYGVYTNLPPASAFRGAMSSQGTWAYESHVDSLARRLGIDPVAFRRRNLLQDGDQYATGEVVHDVHWTECLEACLEGLQWQERELPSAEEKVRYGRGVAVMSKNTLPSSRSECRLALDREGRLTVYTSTVDMGQGSHTALAQIAADGLGLSFDRVIVVGPDTRDTPFDSTTSAARSTSMMGTAVARGAEQLQKELKELAAPIVEHRPEELGAGGGEIYVTDRPAERVSYTEILRRHGREFLEAKGEFATDIPPLDEGTGQGVATPHWHQGAGACEVAVDMETGSVTILRYYAASFAGRIINPQLARLQNEGNVIFGLGPAMQEEVIVGEDGQIANDSLDAYKIPSLLDIPQHLDSISLESDHGEIHGIGEMTLTPVAPAVANAIYDATGVRIYDLPLTAERVLRALNDGT